MSEIDELRAEYFKMQSRLDLLEKEVAILRGASNPRTDPKHRSWVAKNKRMLRLPLHGGEAISEYNPGEAYRYDYKDHCGKMLLSYSDDDFELSLDMLELKHKDEIAELEGRIARYMGEGYLNDAF